MCCERVPNVPCSEGACACAVCVIALLRALDRLRTCRAPKLYQASVLQPRSSKSKHQGYAKVPSPRGCWWEVKQGAMLPTRAVLRLGHPQACALEIASRPLSCTCVHAIDAHTIHTPRVCPAPSTPPLRKTALFWSRAGALLPWRVWVVVKRARPMDVDRAYAGAWHRHRAAPHIVQSGGVIAEVCRAISHCPSTNAATAVTRPLGLLQAQPHAGSRW